MSSARFTVTACTSISTSSGPSSGVGTSRYSITSGPPKRSMITAFMKLIAVGKWFCDRVFERENPVELFGRTRFAVFADLVHVGVDFEQVAVGIEEFHADVAARPAPAFEIDRDATRLQKVTRAEERVDG